MMVYAWIYIDCRFPDGEISFRKSVELAGCPSAGDEVVDNGEPYTVHHVQYSFCGGLWVFLDNCREVVLEKDRLKEGWPSLTESGFGEGDVKCERWFVNSDWEVDERRPHWNGKEWTSVSSYNSGPMSRHWSSAGATMSAFRDRPIPTVRP